MSLLRVENLTIRLADSQRTLVDDISLTIEKGEMLALVGESGSGKSLTALSIMRLLHKGFVTNGQTVLNGQDLALATERQLQELRGNRISMIFQEPMTALNPLHTIERQIGEMITLHSSSYGIAALKTRIHELLAQVGLPHFKDRLDAYPHQLSGGERQRVMIAMAIANNPDLLIADEPTTAVDVTIQAQILKLLKSLQQQLGMSMLFITHDLTLVEKLADRVAVMKAGKLVEIGKVSEVFTNPEHDYTRLLLGSAPKGRALPLTADAQVTVACEQLSVKFPIKRGVFRRTVGHTVAVNDVSMTIRAGETIGIVGESGSGKTTLAFALLRMLQSEGRIIFLGGDITTLRGHALRRLRKDMQLVFQDPYSSLNPRMTVGQIIGEGLKVHLPASADYQQRILDALVEVGLSPDMAERWPHEFSGGQRQRISIARAMVLKPKLVILDEPTSALDLTVQSQILALLKQFQEKLGLSYLFISHDLRVIRAIAHRVVVLKSGSIVETGATDALFHQPATDYTRQLLKAAYLL